jgi:hypothetical protein
MAFQSATERKLWLSRYLALSNGIRWHRALAAAPPFSSSAGYGLLKNDPMRKHT